MIDNWDDLLYFCELKVSDVYITGELGFDLIRVSKIAHNKNVNIRCFVNLNQEKWEKENSFTAFFIRPEDWTILDNIVDVFEFYDSVDKQNTYFNIYFKDKYWYGNLQEIIKGLKTEIQNRFLLESFTEKRINCKRECLKGAYYCANCEAMIMFAKTLSESSEFNYEKSILKNEEEK